MLHRRKRLPFHTNGMRFSALGADGLGRRRREYYSVGGGFVLDQDETGQPRIVPDATPVRYPFTHRRASCSLTAARRGCRSAR